MTALQGLKDYIKGNLNTLNQSISIENRDNSYKAIVLISKNILEQIDELLEIEKQQIIKAYDLGMCDELQESGNQYYEHTYEK